MKCEGYNVILRGNTTETLRMYNWTLFTESSDKLSSSLAETSGSGSWRLVQFLYFTQLNLL